MNEQFEELEMYEEPGFFDEILFFFEGMPPLFAIVPIFIAIVTFIVFFIIIKNAAKAAIERKRNNNSPIETVVSKVIGRRTSIHGGGETRAYNEYYVTFELENGERLEFNVKGEEYGKLAEGDEGELKYQGTRYLGFTRYVVVAK